MTHNEMIEVLLAHKEGKAIQFRFSGTDGDWNDTDDPKWSFQSFDYRIKPDPPPKREAWIVVGGDTEDSGWLKKEYAENQSYCCGGEVVHLTEAPDVEALIKRMGRQRVHHKSEEYNRGFKAGLKRAIEEIWEWSK